MASTDQTLLKIHFCSKPCVVKGLATGLNLFENMFLIPKRMDNNLEHSVYVSTLFWNTLVYTQYVFMTKLKERVVEDVDNVQMISYTHKQTLCSDD